MGAPMKQVQQFVPMFKIFVGLDVRPLLPIYFEVSVPSYVDIRMLLAFLALIYYQDFVYFRKARASAFLDVLFISQCHPKAILYRPSGLDEIERKREVFPALCTLSTADTGNSGIILHFCLYYDPNL